MKQDKREMNFISLFLFNKKSAKMIERRK